VQCDVLLHQTLLAPCERLMGNGRENTVCKVADFVRRHKYQCQLGSITPAPTNTKPLIGVERNAPLPTSI
jgi:hypothetical protein